MAPRLRNPVGFTALPVTVTSVLLYIALFAVLLVIHLELPAAPASPTPGKWPGVNLTEAWLDLKHIGRQHHPFISRGNQEVKEWLVERVGHILDANQVDWESVSRFEASSYAQGANVTVFDDLTTNITYAFAKGGVAYYEGDNIAIYIRGSEDKPGSWWLDSKPYDGPGGVLVNAHFDSVSTGYGVTDDGVGVVTVLQLLAHFTKEQPKKGILLLLNNGEEDGLYGAKAFTQSPLSSFANVFLNLEGAGAGGRAALFRATDTEVVKFYASDHPFGTVVSGDGFKRGLVRSGTDYSVFQTDLSMRGLDVAFMEPRARYHTDQDDTRDTSIESVWHMLSAALATVKGLSEDTSATFDRHSSKDGGSNEGNGSVGVWFDVLGLAFAVLQLHTLFALSVSLLVVAPIILIIFDVSLRKSDRWYPFSRKEYLHSSDDDEPVRMYGWRGFFRFPMAFVVATAAVVALSYLFTKENPYIVYSSPYSVWSCMLGAWLSTSWFVVRLFDSVRPSALARLYTLVWLYSLTWLALVAATIGEHQLQLGSGYFIVVYNAAVFVSLLISYLELFALPKKSVYAQHAFYGPEGDASPTRSGSLVSAGGNHDDDGPRGRQGPATNPPDDEEATERTSLLNSRQTFTRYGGRRRSEHSDAPVQQDPLTSRAYEGEQAWSSSLPSWTWLLQLLLLAPINVILVGQIGLFSTSALYQTPADGNSVFTIYLLFASISTLLILPLTPFLHRMTYHVPTFIFLICIGTLCYNILAFPFSRDNRLKVFFHSQLDLDSGNYSAALTGLQPYVSDIVAELPSVAGQNIHCGQVAWAARNGMESCVWTGLPPRVVPDAYKPKEPNTTYRWTQPNQHQRADNNTKKYTDWIDFNITRPSKNTSGDYIFDIRGANTRACRLDLATRVTNLTIEGAGPTGQGFVPVDDGITPIQNSQVKLWSRTWDAVWRVHISIPVVDDEKSLTRGGEEGRHEGGGAKGKIVCLWADANVEGTIPAFDEVRRYMPVWSAVTKGADGLVEGYKTFVL